MDKIPITEETEEQKEEREFIEMYARHNTFKEEVGLLLAKRGYTRMSLAKREFVLETLDGSLEYICALFSA